MNTIAFNHKEDSIMARLQLAVYSFVPRLLGWAVLLFLMRIGEWMTNGFMHQFPEKPISFFAAIMLADLIFIAKAAFFLVILFTLLSFISFSIAKIGFAVATLIISVGYFALMLYFNSTLVLLGADLYGYSAKDIQQTVGASGGLNIITVALLLLVVLLTVVLVGWFAKKVTPSRFISAAILPAIIMSVFVSAIYPAPGISFKKDFDNNLSKNKVDYFLTASWNHFFPQHQEIDIYADSYLENNVPLVSYIDESHFPFLHSDTAADVLSPYFNSSPTPPDIVVVLVEGLGRAFTNDGAYLGNFTPFLDSLSKQSLYWQNFLSGGGRTFAVLPTVLGSLPFGKNGFNEMENQPKHFSLPAILQKNGYTTSFYYAGDASFDKMDGFMKKQGVDQIQDKSGFPAGYELLPANNGFSWGYGDKELFRLFLDKKRVNQNQPSLSVLLTVSTHSPFLVPGQSAYEQQFERRMTSLNFTEAQKKEHRAYKQQYATILYADDALKTLFSQYSKRADYNNTIFIITGDHRMPEIPMSTKIDRYHVPLIVYSPMLKRAAGFQSISTHFDITPSLLAYMHSNYGTALPSASAWLGTGLDTTRSFQNVHSIALKQTKTDIIDFISGEYHLNGDDLFRLSANMDEEKINDPVMKEKLRTAFLRSQQKNNEFIQGAALIPDSLFTQYHP